MSSGPPIQANRFRAAALLLTGIVTFAASAQERDSSWSAVPGSAIKASPLHLINFYPTIQVSYEQRILPRVTLQAEGGYVLDYGTDDESFENRRGFKARLEGRFYLGPLVDRARIHYVSLEPYMNKVDFDRYAIVEECFDGDCSYPYVRRFPYTIEYREHGVSVKAGMVWYLYSNFFIDGNAGLTFRNIEYNKPELPPGAGHNDDSLLSLNIPNETSRLGFSPNLGVRIGYRFK